MPLDNFFSFMSFSKVLKGEGFEDSGLSSMRKMGIIEVPLGKRC